MQAIVQPFCFAAVLKNPVTALLWLNVRFLAFVQPKPPGRSPAQPEVHPHLVPSSIPVTRSCLSSLTSHQPASIYATFSSAGTVQSGGVSATSIDNNPKGAVGASLQKAPSGVIQIKWSIAKPQDTSQTQGDATILSSQSHLHVAQRKEAERYSNHFPDKQASGTGQQSRTSRDHLQSQPQYSDQHQDAQVPTILAACQSHSSKQQAVCTAGKPPIRPLGLFNTDQSTVNTGARPANVTPSRRTGLFTHEADSQSTAAAAAAAGQGDSHLLPSSHANFQQMDSMPSMGTLNADVYANMDRMTQTNSTMTSTEANIDAYVDMRTCTSKDSADAKAHPISPTALIKQIKTCSTSQKLHSLVQSHAKRMDPGHVVAALRRLQQLAKVSSSCPDALPPNELQLLTQLLQMFVQPHMLSRCNSTELSTMLHALAKLSWHADAAHLHPIVAELAKSSWQKLRQAEPQHISNVVWALARLDHIGYSLPATAWSGVAAVAKDMLSAALANSKAHSSSNVHRQASSVTPQIWSTTLFAFALVKHYDRRLCALAEQAINDEQVLAGALPQHWCNIAWSLAALEHDVSMDTCAAIAERVKTGGLAGGTVQDWSNMLVTVARFGYFDPGLCHTCVRGLAGWIHAWTPQTIANSLHSLAKLYCKEAAEKLLDMLTKRRTVCEQLVSELGPQALCIMLWSLAVLNLLDNRRFGALIVQLIAKVNQLEPEDLGPEELVQLAQVELARRCNTIQQSNHGTASAPAIRSVPATPVVVAELHDTQQPSSTSAPPVQGSAETHIKEELVVAGFRSLKNHRSTVSPAQRDIVQTLKAMQAQGGYDILNVQVEHPVQQLGEGAVCVDVLLELEGRPPIVLEVDGASHFLRAAADTHRTKDHSQVAMLVAGQPSCHAADGAATKASNCDGYDNAFSTSATAMTSGLDDAHIVHVSGQQHVKTFVVGAADKVDTGMTDCQRCGSSIEDHLARGVCDISALAEARWAFTSPTGSDHSKPDLLTQAQPSGDWLRDTSVHDSAGINCSATARASAHTEHTASVQHVADTKQGSSRQQNVRAHPRVDNAPCNFKVDGYMMSKVHHAMLRDGATQLRDRLLQHVFDGKGNVISVTGAWPLDASPGVKQALLGYLLGWCRQPLTKSTIAAG